MSEESMRAAIKETALGVMKLGDDLYKTRARLLSLETVVATILANTTGISPQAAHEMIRHQAESVTPATDIDEELAAIRTLLASLENQKPGRA